MTALTKAQVITGLRGFAAMVFTIAASPVLHAAGVSFQAISVGFGVLYSILALSQIPTGVWADLFGPRKASLVGGLIQVLGLVLLATVSPSGFGIIVGFGLYGFGSSFVAGALSSLLYSANQRQSGGKFDSGGYFSSIEKAAVISYILASASVGFLGEWFGRGAFLVGAAGFAFSSILTAVALPELTAEVIAGPRRLQFVIRTKLGFSEVRKSLKLRLLIPIRILHQVETILGVLWLPWIVALGGGKAKWISVLATGSYLARYFVSHWLARKQRSGFHMRRIATSLLCMAVGAVVCVFAESLWMALAGVWIMAAARGAFLPAVQAVQHEELPEGVRTTGISVVNFSTDAVFALSYFISAPFIDGMAVSIAWSVSAACFLIAALIALDPFAKDFSKPSEVRH